VERIIHDVAGEHGRPVIKWMDTPGRASEYLLRVPMDELAQMPTGQFWPFPSSVSAANDDARERSDELYLHATRVLGVEEHGRALLAPKLSYKTEAIASWSRPEAEVTKRGLGPGTTRQHRLSCKECPRAAMISPGGTRLSSGRSKMGPVQPRFRQTARNIGSLINFFGSQLYPHRNDRASAKVSFS
jgi:hypothetical protein